MKNFTKYKNSILSIIISFVTYLAFLIYFKIIFSLKSYNFILSLLFFFLYYFYKKENNKFAKYNKRTKIIINTFSLLISIILIVGSIVSSYLGDGGAKIFNSHNIVYSIVGIIGFYFFFRSILGNIFKYLDTIKINGKRTFTRSNFIKVVILIFLCWFPYFLRYFPGVMTNDSYYSLHNIKNVIISDYHTLGHTWFVGFFVNIGNFLFGKYNYGVALYIIIQMLSNSFMFTLIIKFLYEKNVKKEIILIVTIFICLSPLYAIYSITLWRDILFGTAFILLFISLYEYINSNYRLSKNTIIMYFISIFIILFFRNNGIYVFILFFPILVLLSKYNKKILFISNLLIIIVYFLIKGPVFDYFKVEKSTSSEAYSIPLQQISRVIYSGAEIDTDDSISLNRMIDLEKISNNYDPVISDPIKRLVNNKELSENKITFFKIWFKLLVKYPRTYVEAYLCQTLGYWYPDVAYWATAGESKSIFEDVDVYSEPKVPNIIKKMDIFTSRKIPLSNLIWSLGIMFIILLFAISQLIYRKKYEYLLCYAPLICLWITIMIATPVFAELRYVYGLFTCLPLVLICPFIEPKDLKRSFN